ncbi:MAG: sigma 54-interacting transcriptional regulator [Labilithrix sp.]|nr:sigma 54-interacting transcriptional regulator [Labilithrix sp.]
MARELDDERPESTQTGLGHPTVRREPAIVATVTVTDGGGVRAVVVDEVLVVGASNEVALVLRDPKVSRLHAELASRADGLWVTDLGSKNGTWLEGIRVGSALVPNGGTIRLGDATLVVGYRKGERQRELWAHPRFHRLRGGSDPMRALYARLARCAASEATVLVRGETGTGKELVAEALHDASPRAGMPFVVVDCAAMPANLLEAELFGVKRGAFTGADRDRPGAVEAAEGGTLFLDEIGELPIELQPKLLRLLETRTFRRLGESQHRKADVRIVCATHRDLRRAATEGTFREDLYFRVAVLVADVPPLRERLDDLSSLVAHFAESRLAPADLDELLRRARVRPWPGNVRELRNFVERAVALGLTGASTQRSAGDPSATPATFAFDVPDDRPLAEVRQRAGDHVEREYVRKVLARFDGNVTRAAEHAGIARQHLHRLMKRSQG